MSVRPRGRPRSFDTDEALDQALELFWACGFEATSLDDIAAATGIARPSLTAAFGDKEALYVKAMSRFAARMRDIFSDSFYPSEPLARALTRFYRRALDVYAGGATPRGCLVLCTAPAVAPGHKDVRTVLIDAIREGDKAFEGVFRRARAKGALAHDADLASLARLASATLQTLALRARAGASRRELDRVAVDAVDLLCRA